MADVAGEVGEAFAHGSPHADQINKISANAASIKGRELFAAEVKITPQRK
jgi:hypothetical protein